MLAGGSHKLACYWIVYTYPKSKVLIFEKTQDLNLANLAKVL